MSIFILKIIAVISMIFDHTGYIIIKDFSFMNYIGRLAFPIFAFCITEGFIHTSNLKKYFLRLGIFAIISQIPYMFFTSAFSNNYNLNIMFTLLLGLLSITLYDKSKNKLLGILTVILSSIATFFLPFDYGWFGIAIIFMFYIFKKNKLLLNLSFILITIINYVYKYIEIFRYEYFLIIIFVCLSLIPINLYNGKKGKNAKYILYVFYPLHLIILYLINLYIL